MLPASVPTGHSFVEGLTELEYSPRMILFTLPLLTQSQSELTSPHAEVYVWQE